MACFSRVRLSPTAQETVQKAVSFLLQVFLDHGLNLDRTKVADETFSDPKDIVFYEVKMSKEDAYLVTGNTRHFPRKPFVITPRGMCKVPLQKV